MATDIRLRIGWSRHPKIVKLHRRLGSEGVLGLVTLWTWAGESRPNGCLDGLDADSIAIAAGYPGDANQFVATLINLGLLDQAENGDVVIHDWEDHQPYASGKLYRIDPNAPTEPVYRTWRRKGDDGSRIYPENWDAIKTAVYKRDGRKCHYCADENGPFHLDHVIPRSRGGLDTVENLVVACKSCNMDKGDRTLEEWLNGSKSPVSTSRNDLVALDALRDMASNHLSRPTAPEWKKRCEAEGVNQRTFYRVMQRLIKSGQVQIKGDFLEVIEDAVNDLPAVKRDETQCNAVKQGGVSP